jgi:CRP-like cAMP-binding protein
MEIFIEQRLEGLDVIRDSDLVILGRLRRETREYASGTVIQREEEPIQRSQIIASGWAARIRAAPDGTRQIVNFLVPGDSFGFYGALNNTSDSSVEMLTDGKVIEIPCEELVDTFTKAGRLAFALCWVAAQDDRALADQIFRIGALSAVHRIAHLLVELQNRLLSRGYPPIEAMILPITQKQLAEALGISHVHANRCCRKLQKEGLIETNGSGVLICEPGALREFSVYRKPDGTGPGAPEVSCH